MGWLAGWLFRRFRMVYVRTLLVLLFSFISVGTLLPLVGGFALYFDLSPTGFAALWGVTSGAIALAILIGYWWGRPLLRPITQWLRGESTDATAARDAVVLGVQDLIRYVGIVAYLLVITVVTPAFTMSADLGPAAVAAFAVIVLLGFAPGILLIAGLGVRVLAEPLLDELGRVAVDQLPRRGWSLRGRFHLGVLNTGVLVGMGAGAVVDVPRTNEGEFVSAVVASVLLSLYVVVLFELGLVRPTLRPVRDLLEATRRVRLGVLEVPVPVTSADEFGDVAAAFNEMQSGLREREALNAAFGSYVDPALAQRLLASGSSLFEGEDLLVTVLFADVLDFTGFAESVEPAEAVLVLNRLFDVIVPVLHEHGGHANHYLGDGLLAVFGAPTPLSRHPDAAVAAAVEMQRRVRAEFGSELRLGVGINTGPVIAGTVGGGGRHEFTVIGDTVNVAARVEQLTRETGDAILITEATRAALSVPRPRSAKRGAFDLKGKAAKVTVHAVNPFPRSNRELRGA